MTFGGIFDVEGKEGRLRHLEELSGQAEFWTNADKAKTTLQEKTRLEKVVVPYRQAEKLLMDSGELLDMAVAENDDATVQDIFGEIQKGRALVDQMEFQRMLGGEAEDRKSVV